MKRRLPSLSNNQDIVHCTYSASHTNNNSFTCHEIKLAGMNVFALVADLLRKLIDGRMGLECFEFDSA